MLITTLVVLFCKGGKKTHPTHTREHYDHHTQRITTIKINRNTLSSTTERQRTSHRTYTTKNHYFTLTLPLFISTERDDQCGNQHFNRELLVMGIVVPETC